MATTHHFVPTVYHLTIGSHQPVMRIKPGDQVTTSTVDSRGFDASRTPVVGHGNGQTGPFYIEGAAPGDILSVRFDSISPNRTYGYSGCGLSSNVVDPKHVPHIPGEGDSSIWYVDLQTNTATLEKPKIGIDPFTVSLNPMIGSFGVAPERGQAISARTSGNHGGNMDYRGIVAGVTVYFPVFVEGALFHLGDGHAAQGDGEILGRGIEISMDVTFTVDLIQATGTNSNSDADASEPRANWPRGEDDTFIFAIGNARPLDQALQHATTEMLRWLEQDFGMDTPTAHMFLGTHVRYEVANVFNPAYTVICKVNKKHLPDKI